MNQDAWNLNDAGGDGCLADAATDRLIEHSVGVVAAKSCGQVLNRFASLQGSIRTLLPLFSSSTMRPKDCSKALPLASLRPATVTQ